MHWYYIQMSLEVNIGTVESLMGTFVQFSINGHVENISSAMYDIVVDQHYTRSAHRLGVLQFNLRHGDWYHGLIYSFEVTQGVPAADAAFEIEHT